MKKALDDLNIEKEMAKARAEIAGGKKTYRDKAIRKLQYLEAANRLGQHPRDWFTDRVPVLPPMFRPVSLMGDTGKPLVTDANYLYKEAFDANRLFRNSHGTFDDAARSCP